MQPGHSEDNNEARAMAISPRLPREARGVYVVNGVLDEVLQEVRRPTAPISEEDVPLRNPISWT